MSTGFFCFNSETPSDVSGWKRQVESHVSNRWGCYPLLGGPQSLTREYAISPSYPLPSPRRQLKGVQAES